MATRTGHIAQRITARVPGKRAARSIPVRFLGRAGFLARGFLYMIIGWIAVEVAFGKTSQQADRAGALQAVGRSPAGQVALWALATGFFGMALWRLSEALFGATGPDGGKAKTRLTAFGKAVLYAVLGYGVADYAIDASAPPSTDQQSVDLTATLMRYPGGRVAVGVTGLVLVGVGLYLAWQAWWKRFRDNLLLNQMGTAVTRVVEWLGRAGGVARGIVFATAGAFLVAAAVNAQPGQAKGIDSSLRQLAATPGGPWLLVIVAAGLIMFGFYSCCEARWRRV